MNNKNEKKRYIVKLEGMVPVELEYIVFAKSQAEAFEIIDQKFLTYPPRTQPKMLLNRLKKTKIQVINSLTGISKILKRYL